MVTAQDYSQNLVTFNSKKYAIIGGVQTEQANEFAPQFTIGEETYSRRENVSQLVFSGLTGGHGKKRVSGMEGAGQYWRNYNIETRFPGVITLGPLPVSAASLTIGYNLDTYHHSSHCMFRGTDYFALGDKVFSWNGSSASEVLDVSASQTSYVVDLQVHVDSSGVPHMYAFLSSNGGAFYVTADGSSWAQGTNTLGQSLIDFDGHAIILGGTDIKSQIDTSDLPDGALASYTTMFTFGSGSALQKYPQSGIVFRNASGDLAPYVLMAEKDISAITANHPLARLYVMDYYARTLRPVAIAPLRFSHTRGNRMAVWNDALYIPSGPKLFKFNVDTYEDIGPAQDQGIGSNFQHFHSVAASDRWLYVMMKPTVSHTGQFILGAYNGQGIHTVVRSAGLSDSVARGIHVSPLRPGRVYWISGDHAGTAAQLNYIDDTDVDPSTVSTYSYASDTAEVITPWTDLGFANLTKAMLRMSCTGQALTSTESLTVAYQIAPNTDTDDGTWTTLGTFTSSGTSVSFGSGAGIACTNVRFKFTLARGGTATLAPLINAVVLDFQVRPDYRAVKSFVVSVNNTIAARGAPAITAADLVSELKTAFNTDTLLDFQHGDDTAIKTQLISWPYVLYDETDTTRDGQISVQLLEPIAS